MYIKALPMFFDFLIELAPEFEPGADTGTPSGLASNILTG